MIYICIIYFLTISCIVAQKIIKYVIINLFLCAMCVCVTVTIFYLPDVVSSPSRSVTFL